MSSPPAPVAGAPDAPLGASTDVIADVVRLADFPPAWPFSDGHFAKDDARPDADFYAAPRLVAHLDAGATFALTEAYADALPRLARAPGEPVAALDLCSSWLSHLPADFDASRVAGLGLNELELSRNGALARYVVKDLNAACAAAASAAGGAGPPLLPYADGEFDAVLCALSVQYWTHPREVLRDVLRVLRPGGQLLVSFSNRCFPSKAVAAWAATGDADHVWLVAAYLHYAAAPDGARFTDISGADLSPSRETDPLFLVRGTKGPAA